MVSIDYDSDRAGLCLLLKLTTKIEHRLGQITHDFISLFYLGDGLGAQLITFARRLYDALLDSETLYSF